MAGFDFLDEFVDKDPVPSNIDSILYLFWERGIDYNAFKRLPIPYIITVLKTHSWVKKQEEKEYKKAQRKR